MRGPCDILRANFAKFQSEIFDFDLCKIFSMVKNGGNSPDFPLIYFNRQQVLVGSRNREDFQIFLLSCMLYSQTWLNFLVDDHLLAYVRTIKKTLVWAIEPTRKMWKKQWVLIAGSTKVLSAFLFLFCLPICPIKMLPNYMMRCHAMQVLIASPDHYRFRTCITRAHNMTPHYVLGSRADKEKRAGSTKVQKALSTPNEL